MPDEPKTNESSGSSPEPAHPAAPAVRDDAPVAPDAPLEVAPGAESTEAHEHESHEPQEADDASDAASPAAILKRVSALDEDDDAERVARAEEAKLEARRNLGKKPKKKSGLEAAASKRLSKIGAKAPVKREIAVAADADPLIDRAAEWSKWAKKNQAVVTGATLVAIAIVAGSLGFTAYQHKRENDASAELAKAVADERGRIGDPDKEDDPDRPHDPTPIFKTTDDRRDAALAGYRAVESKFHGTGAAILARLSEGSLLLDKDDADGALAAYGDVAISALAKADAEVRGRALEGMGFAYELKADAANAQPDAGKDLLEKAGKEFRELENTDVDGFKELGMYHEARVLQKQGTTDQAIELLKKLHERLQKEKETHSFVYLDTVADDALRSLSPDAIPPKQSGGGMGGIPGMAMGMGGGKGKSPLSPAQMKQLYEQFAKQQGAAGGGKPPMPAGAPK